MEVDSSETNENPEAILSPTKRISATPVLPPCYVCGDKSSGFHYGANTCEACKGFFRRSLARKDKYKCSNNEDCNIGSGNRACSKCRYDKCLTVGMSKKAIKTGRYTHKKRTQDTLEIKGLKSGTLDMQVETLPQLKNTRNEGIDDGYSPSASTVLSEIVIDADIPLECSNSSTKSTLTTNSPTKSTRITNSTTSEFNEVKKLEEMIEKLVKVHTEQVSCHTTLDVKDMEKETSDYHEKYELKKEMFGNLKMLPMQQYNDFYNMTGIDIDNRQDRMAVITSTMKNIIKCLIIFAKAIPGFSELSINDQSNLIKASRFEFFLLGHFKGYNSQIKTFLTPNNICVCAEEVSEFMKEEFISKVFAFSDSMKKLELNYTETVLIKAIVITFRDRCCLDDPDRVEKIQWSLIQCLMHILNKNRPSQPDIFSKVMNQLMVIRTITEENYRLCKNLLFWPGIQDSPLLHEIMSF